MDSLRIGFFHDSSQRDHVFTLSGLEDAYRRSRSTSSCFRADANADAPPAPEPFDDELTLFDAISLEPEFAAHPILGQSLFLLDSAVDITALPWRDGELDAFGAVGRVAALDLRPWAQFNEMFAREIPLLPAPLAAHRGAVSRASHRVALIINDISLHRRIGPEFTTALRRVDPEIAVTEVHNSYLEPMRQSEWLAPALAEAGIHVHIGPPAESLSFGRLIDSMNMRAPCVVFDDGAGPIDANAKFVWRRPAYRPGVNFLQAQSLAELAEATLSVARDPAFAQLLVRNALREVAVFHEEVQSSLLPSQFVENYLERAA